MTDKSVKLFALSVKTLGEILGMQAENSQRKLHGHSMAFAENTFYEVGEELRLAIKAAQEATND